MGCYAQYREQLPRVSVIVPVRNEQEYIEQCLMSVVGQDYPAEKMEVIVVDGLSKDDTRKTARRTLESNGLLGWRVLANPAKVTPAALNRGIEAASGQVIVRVDGHATIARDYVRKCVEVLAETGAGCVGGHMRPVGSGLVGGAIAAAHLSPFGLGGGKFHDLSYEGPADTVYLGCWPREVFQTVGMFDESLYRNQDIELNSRIRSNSQDVYLSKDIIVHYHPRSSLISLARQHFQTGRWNVITRRRSPGALSIRHFVPAAFVASLLISLALIPVRGAGLYMIAGIAGAYTLANVGAAVHSGLTHGLSGTFLLPPVFATMHLSYGLGLLYGILASPRLTNLQRFPSLSWHATTGCSTTQDERAPAACSADDTSTASDRGPG